MLVTALARRIKRLRSDRGLTVRELAAALNKSPAYVAKLETRGELPSPDLTRKIAQVLDAPANELLALVKQVRLAAYARDLERQYPTAPATLSSGQVDERNGSVASIVSLINMKGGVGKTTLAMQLAHTADSLDLRTLAIDLDPQSNLSQVLMGPSAYAEHVEEDNPTVVDIFNDQLPIGASTGPLLKSDVQELIVKGAGYWQHSTLDLLPSRLELSGVLKNPTSKERKLANALKRIRDEYDLIIIDCAPTESILTDAAYYASDYVVVPVKPEFMATIGLPLLARSLAQFQRDNEESNIQVAGLIFNHSSSYSSGPEGQRSIGDVIREAEKHDWHIFEHQVPYSAAFAKAAREQAPLSQTSYARGDVVQSFRRLANEIFERIGVREAVA